MTPSWFRSYDPGVPATIQTYPDTTLVDVVARHATERPTAVATAFKGSYVTFGQLDAASDALAHSLAADGVKAGDRVALLLPNTPQFLIAELAIWKLGAIVAPQNPIYTERELAESLSTTNPEVIITLSLFYERVKNCQPQTTLRRVIATSIKEYLPPLLRVAFTLLLEKKEGHRIALREGDAWFQDLLARGSKMGRRESLAKPGDPAMVLMSGGTTGTPKGAMSEHRHLLMSATQLLAWLSEPLSGERPSIMLPLPLFHTYGFAGAQTMTLLRGIPLILVPNPRDIGDVLATIKREKPPILCGVPSLFNAILSHPQVVRGKVDLGSIKACFSGAAALMAETKKRFEEKTGGRIVEGYSLTEATMACLVNPYRGTNKLGSVGMPLPDIRARIVDSDEGTRELPTGEVGEIAIQAPNLMRGYWNNAEETALMLRKDPDGATWLYTGDLGYIDDDGFVFIVDRKKDLIKAGGFQVWPREIEEVIAKHPAVAEVGVAGVADPHKGEVIYAWVVKRAGAAPLTADELRLYCKDYMAPFKVPSRIEFRSELPKTMVGKTLRRVLVAEARAALSA